MSGTESVAPMHFRIPVQPRDERDQVSQRVSLKSEAKDRWIEVLKVIAEPLQLNEGVCLSLCVEELAGDLATDPSLSARRWPLRAPSFSASNFQPGSGLH